MYILNVLKPGSVPHLYFQFLIEISSVRSKKVIEALHDHLVQGHSRIISCNNHQVGQGYLSVKIKELKQLNRKVCEFYSSYTSLKV